MSRSGIELLDSLRLDEQFTGPGECIMKFSLYRTRFIVRLNRPDNESKLFDLLDCQDDGNENFETERIIEDFREDHILPACMEVIQSLAPKNANPDREWTLEEFLFPETFFPQCRTVHGHLKAEYLDFEPTPAHLIPLCLPMSEKFLHIKDVKPRDIIFLEDLHMGLVLKVSWKSSICVFKSNHDGASEQLKREIETLQALSKPRVTRSHPRMQIPRLLGLVSTSDGILGMLTEYVDGKSLGHMNLTTVSLKKRRDWARQIEDAVKILHRHGVVWGDVKADNVLIHRVDETPWVIDFGGSYTNGWIEPRLRETIEGDMQGLQKIVEFLEKGTSELVQPSFSDESLAIAD